MIDLLTEDSHSIRSLLEDDGEIDYERREDAGKVVQPLNYEKRIHNLIYELPKPIVNTVREYGCEAPGLKGKFIRYPHEVYDLRKWWDGVYSVLPLIIQDKFDQITKWKKEAYNLIPKQSRYTDEDVEIAFTGHFQDIFDALKRSAEEKERRDFEIELAEADLDNMYI